MKAAHPPRARAQTADDTTSTRHRRPDAPTTVLTSAARRGDTVVPRTPPPGNIIPPVAATIPPGTRFGRAQLPRCAAGHSITHNYATPPPTTRTTAAWPAATHRQRSSRCHGAGRRQPTNVTTPLPRLTELLFSLPAIAAVAARAHAPGRQQRRHPRPHHYQRGQFEPHVRAARVGAVLCVLCFRWRRYRTTALPVPAYLWSCTLSARFLAEESLFSRINSTDRTKPYFSAASVFTLVPERPA
jgi:hypothetical protein